MTKHFMSAAGATEGRRKAAIQWGRDKATGAHCVLFNDAAWKVITYVAEFVGKEPKTAVADVVSGLLTVGAKAPSAIYLQWKVIDKRVALIFDLECFCVCVELSSATAKELVVTAFTEQLLYLSYEIDPNKRT